MNSNNNNNDGVPEDEFLISFDFPPDISQPWEPTKYFETVFRLNRNQLEEHQLCLITEIKRDLQRLQQNDPSFTSYKCFFPPHYFTDVDFHNSLGEALARSIHLRRLELRAFVVNEEMAEAVARGIGQSNLNYVYITDWIEPTSVGVEEARRMKLWQPLYQGLQSSRTIQELRCKRLPIKAVLGLGQNLPLMKSLRKLVLDEPIMTEAAAQGLATGMARSTLEALAITLDSMADEPTIGRILYQGIILSQTIQEFALESARMEHIVDLGEALPLMKRLRKLCLDGYSLQMTEPGGQALTRGICQSNLECLTIWHSTEQNQSELYRRLLFDVLRENKSITTLELMRIPGPGLGYDFTLLSEGLRRNTSITSLLLDSESFLERNIELLFSRGLRHNTTLTELKFQKCGNCNDMFRWLEVHWPVDSSIDSLSFKVTNLETMFDARPLLRVVAGHPVLRKLELSTLSDTYADHTGYDVLTIIGEGLFNQQHLTDVNLSSCAFFAPDNLNDEDTKGRYERARLAAGQALIEGMQNNPHIQNLNVQGNGFATHVEHDISYYAFLNRNGRFLLSANDGVATSVWPTILAKCQRQHEISQSLTFFYLREQPHLVQPSSTPTNNARPRSDEE
jgi:hypothetical protein